MAGKDMNDDDKKGVSTGRLAIWLVVGAVGAYFLITGVWGILTPG